MTTNDNMPNDSSSPGNSIKIYFDNEAGCYSLGQWCQFNIGHVALEIALSPTWYRYYLSTSRPDVNDPTLTASYTLYPIDENEYQVLLVHAAGVSETIIIRRTDVTVFYNDAINPLLLQASELSQPMLETLFPQQLLDFIVKVSRYLQSDHCLYLSFSPQDQPENFDHLWSTAGEFSTKQSSGYKTRSDPIIVTRLDNRAAYQAAVRLLAAFLQANRESMAQQRLPAAARWGIGFGYHNCASVGAELLEAGSIAARMPSYGFNAYSYLKHVILLSLRPAATITAFFPLCHTILFLETHESDHPKEQVVSAFGALIMLLCLLEKYGIKYFPCLKNTAYRGRELVETNGFGDTLTQIVSFSAVGVSTLFFDIEVFEQLSSHDQPWLRFLLLSADAFLLTLSSMAIYLGTGLVMNLGVNLFQGRIIKTPEFIYQLGCYLTKVEKIPNEVLALQFKKEMTLLIIMIFSLFANFISRCYAAELVQGHQDDPFFLAGEVVLFGLGYCLTKPLIGWIDRQQQVLLSRETGDIALIKQQLASHDPKPELSMLTIFLCSVSMLITAKMTLGEIHAVSATWLTAAAGLIAYTAVTVLYGAVCHGVDQCRHRFFHDSQASLLASEEDTEQQPSMNAEEMYAL